VRQQFTLGMASSGRRWRFRSGSDRPCVSGMRPRCRGGLECDEGPARKRGRVSRLTDIRGRSRPSPVSSNARPRVGRRVRSTLCAAELPLGFRPRAGLARSRDSLAQWRGERDIKLRDSPNKKRVAQHKAGPPKAD